MARDVNAYIQKRGYQPIKWAKCTFILTFVFLFVTILVHFYKADFVNLTVCTLAFLLLSNADKSNKTHFRLLTAGIVVSMAYDVAWFILKSEELLSKDDGDGGVEETIRKFSLTMAIISFILKIVMSFVYWMASMNYADILDERQLLV